MSAYRPTPKVPGLPLPRRNLALYVALVVSAAVLVAVAPGMLARTFRRAVAYREYERFMVSSLVAIVTAIVGGSTGARAARGGRRAQVVVALLPIWAVWAGVLLPFWRSGQANAMAEPRLPVDELGQLLATGDALAAHGCFTASLACGLGVVALLGAGASIDRRDHHGGARARQASGTTVVLGLGALLVAVLASFLSPVGFRALLFVLPSFVVVTALAGISAANAPVVCSWDEPRETDAWVQAVLGAAVLAALGVFLLERTFALTSEAEAVRALTQGVSHEAADTVARVEMLHALLGDARAHDRIGTVLALAALVVIAPAGLAGLRVEGGRRRWPRGKVLGAALGAAVVILVALGRGRVALLHELDRRASGVADDVATREGLELPRIDTTATRTPTEPENNPFHIRVRVDATGMVDAQRVRPTVLAAPPDAPDAERIVLVADRRARWEHVSRAIEQGILLRWADEPGHDLPLLEIRGLPTAAVDRSRAGALAPLLGPDAVGLVVALERSKMPSNAERLVIPAEHETVESVTNAIVLRRRGPHRQVELLLPPRTP